MTLLSRRSAKTALLATVLGLGAMVTEGVAQGAAPRLASHTAVYDLSLDTRRPARGIDGASGRIAFETAGNRCEGFTTTFRQVVALQASGEQILMDTRTTNFEEGDGSAFRFTTQSTQNGQAREASDGGARRGDGQLTMTLRQPRAASSTVPGDVIFPTAHLFRILERARAGETILEVKVYDGSDGGEKHYDTTAVIGRRIEPGQGTVEPAAQNSPLQGLARWPVTISYFEAGKDKASPDYSISFELYENGVSRGLVIDYGEFRLRGTLTSLQFIADGACDR